MNEKFKSRPYLISASVLDFVCTAAYLAVSINCVIAGLSVVASAGKMPENPSASDAAGAAIGAPFLVISVY